MSTATLAQHTVTHASVTIPAWGAWYAEAQLAEEREIEGAVDLVIADLTLKGTIVSGGTSNGRSFYRVAAGAGGWGTAVPAKGYAADAGVQLLSILQDAAALAGETLDVATVATSSVGSAFVREAGPAARVLQLFSPRSWYVGEDGVTRLGRRARAELSTLATRQRPDPARRTVVLAAEEIAAILPGAVVDGIEAVDVMHELEPGALRSTIWGDGPATTSRRAIALERVVRQLLPDLRYRGVYAYRVVTQEGERLNLQPVRVSTGMPDLGRVRVMPGVAGCRADVALGSTVLVAFVDADPTRPVVVGFEDAEGAGFRPSRLDLVGAGDALLGGTEGVGRVVCYGDRIIFKVGQPPVDTPLEVKAFPADPVTVSRVRGR